MTVRLRNHQKLAGCPFIGSILPIYGEQYCIHFPFYPLTHLLR